MAALTQFRQTYVALKNGTGKVLGIHEVTLKSSSDTITVPTLDNSTSGASAAHLRFSGQSALTITTSGNTVTIANGSAGDEAVIVTLHTNRRNIIPEE